MKNKIIIIVSIIILIIIVIFFYVMFHQDKIATQKEINKEPLYGTDLNKDLHAKAMIYLANNYNYTTENYIIELKEENNNYLADIQDKSGKKVENIIIKIDDLKKWTPNDASPEGNQSTSPEAPQIGMPVQ